MENLNSKHDELRNDFNSFTVDISKWQIDTDRRIADAENDISGESHHEIDLMSLTPYQTFMKFPDSFTNSYKLFREQTGPF